MKPEFYQIELTPSQLDEVLRALRKMIADECPAILPVAERALQELEAAKYAGENGDES